MNIDVAAERAASRRRRGLEVEEEPTFGPADPSAEVLSRHYISKAAPYIQAIRQQVFGGPEAPFIDDPAAAEGWLNGWTRRSLEGKASPEDGQFEAAVRELAKVTGFQRRGVQDWILQDEEPRLPAYSLAAPHHALPGTPLRTRRVEITLYTPITEAAMRRLWRMVRDAWSDPDAFIEPGRRSRPRGPTEKDAALLEIMKQMPLESYTWSDRSDAWANAGHAPVSADALRMRWHRLQEKLEALTPEEDNDG